MRIRYPKIFKDGMLTYNLQVQDGANVLYSVRYNNDIIGYEVNPWTPQIAFEIDGQLVKKRRNPDDRSSHPEDNFFQSYDNALAKYRELSSTSKPAQGPDESGDKPVI
ncbi:MAG: hypothetical protein ACW99Q_14245 [Candidatus Kariarchaeaceae archaeon]|jgi:hypothetical protein